MSIESSTHITCDCQCSFTGSETECLSGVDDRYVLSCPCRSPGLKCSVLTSYPLLHSATNVLHAYVLLFLNISYVLMEFQCIGDGVISMDSEVWLLSLVAFVFDPSMMIFTAFTGARLDREHSVRRKKPRPRTLLISVFSPVFFFAPEVHLMEVEKIFTDEVLNHTTWKPFIDKLLAEWQEFVLFVCSAVFLHFTRSLMRGRISFREPCC